MSDYNELRGDDIMRDQAPGLFARLHADYKGAQHTGMGRDIAHLYDDHLSSSVAYHDYAPADQNARDIVRLTRTLLAESHLIDALSTYEVDRGRLQRQRHGTSAEDAAAEFEKEEYILKAMHGPRQRLHERSITLEATCRRVLNQLPQPSDALAVHLNEFDTALHDVKEAFWQNHQMLTVIRNNDDLRFSDPERARDDNETRSFMFEVIHDARQVTEQIQKIVATLEKGETRDTEGPQPIATAVQRVTQGLGMAPESAKPERPKRGPRGQYDEARVQEALQGNEAVNIFSARDTESYRDRMKDKGSAERG